MFDLLLLSGITLAAMSSPGPDMFLLARNGLIHGKTVGLATVFGICAGLAIHVGLSVVGLAWLITNNIYIYEIVRLLGAGYLIYIGINALRSKGISNFDIGNGGQEKAISDGLRDGFLCNLLNPKVTIFIFSVFTQFIGPGDSFLYKAACGGVIVSTAFLGWSIFIVIVQSNAFRKKIESFGALLDRVFGGLMIAIGLRMALIRD